MRFVMPDFMELQDARRLMSMAGQRWIAMLCGVPMVLFPSNHQDRFRYP